MANVEDHTLTNRAVTGDQRALQCLLLRHHEAVLNVIQRDFPAELRRVADPEDILQMTWIDAVDAISHFDPTQKTGLFGWLCAIAKRNCTDVVRFHRAAKRGGNALALELTNAGSSDETNQSLERLINLALDQAPTASRIASGKEALAALYLAMDTLSPEHRQAIDLRYIQCLSVADVATKMNRSERAVHGLCYRAMREMRRSIGKFSRFFTST